MKLFERFTRPIRVNISIEQGKRGRWRWYAKQSNGYVLAQSSVYGYGTASEARTAATKAIEKTRVGKITVQQPDGGE